MNNISKLAYRLQPNVKWQRKIGIGLVLLTIIIAYLVYNLLSTGLAFAWVFGLLIGFTLQRSKICFTAALRDPLLFGMTGATRAIILSLIITTLGYAGMQYYQLAHGLNLVGKFTPLGWHIPLGAFIFGIGAAISGGCASGTLVRLGEGFQLQIVVLIGFIIGSTHGAYDGAWWYHLFSETKVHLPSIIGWKLGIGLQLVVLVLLYVVAYLWEKHKF
ncbi:YeeE/YedE thiosulfate transporter family protein [Halobacteroides halobius]|uniref:YeeE/YedE thiosulfate transporter family protein n=1 Tax=Halobacteroides halobius TaxID=42422 RepID=UPI001FDEF240|nr:YeeE/YedE thiosulfate transporter family protein [Halobacteroides halobius]